MKLFLYNKTTKINTQVNGPGLNDLKFEYIFIW